MSMEVLHLRRKDMKKYKKAGTKQSSIATPG